MSKAKKLSLSVIFQFISIIVTGLVGILIVPIIINLLGREYYGVLEIILSLMFINFFFELGMGSTLLRFIPVYEKKGKEELNSFLWTYLYLKSILALIATIIVLIIGFYFNHFFNIGQTDVIMVKNTVFIFAMGIFVTNIATFFSNTLKGFQRFDFAIIPDITAQIFFLILILILKPIGFKNVNIMTIAFIMFIIRPLIRIIIAIFFLRKTASYIRFHPAKPQIRILKESLQFLKGMSFISLFAQFYNQAPKMILGIILNPVSVAYWGIAERLRNPIQQINSSLIRPLIPMASGMDIENERHKTSKLIIKITKVNFLLIGGIVSFVFLYINVFIKIWIGNEFLQVGNIIRIWFIPFILPNPSVLMMFYYAKGKTKLSQNMSILNSFVGLILGSLFVLKFDTTGFAFGLTLSSVLITVINFHYLCKEFYLSFWSIFKKAYAIPYLVVGLTMLINFLLIKFIQINNWPLLVLSLSIGLTFYVLNILITLSYEEKKFYGGLIKSFINN